jgi:hypothetical protein
MNLLVDQQILSMHVSEVGGSTNRNISPIYKELTSIGRQRSPYMWIWNTKAPRSVKTLLSCSSSIGCSHTTSWPEERWTVTWPTLCVHNAPPNLRSTSSSYTHMQFNFDIAYQFTTEHEFCASTLHWIH